MALKLFIPACGDRLRLAAPWSFDLHLEHRNTKFAALMKLHDLKETDYNVYESGERWPRDVRDRLKRVRPTLPAGTVLECDRVYIRTFNKSRIQLDNDFDSITWKLVRDGKAVRGGRFWVKLPDCYEIEYELETDSLYRNRIKAVKEVLES